MTHRPARRGPLTGPLLKYIPLAAAALACNLPAFRDDSGDTPGGLTAEPDATITTLPDLLDVLQQWR